MKIFIRSLCVFMVFAALLLLHGSQSSAEDALIGGYRDRLYSNDEGFDRYRTTPEAVRADDPYATEDEQSTNQRIQTIFDGLQTVGGSINSNSEKDAALSLLDKGCHSLVAAVMESAMFSGMGENFLGLDALPGGVNEFMAGKASQIRMTSLNAACAAMRGEAMPSIDLRSTGQQEILPMLLLAGQSAAQGSGIPFLSRIELETGLEGGEYYGSLTTVQPLWEDANDRHHVFTQLSWYRTNEENYADTVNAGIAYRHLNEAKDMILGANVFFDHAYERNHNRMSLGVDARTSLIGVSANRYIPLSGWKSVDALVEEKATAGWDLELRGQVPQLPSWTGSVKGYTYDGHGGETDTYGYEAGLEYSPIPALALRAGMRDESHEDPALEMAMRFNWRFDQPSDIQLRPRLELAPVADYVYDKVHRENRIRVSQRLKERATFVVLATVGANTSTSNGVTLSLAVGQSIVLPATLTTANTVGANARFRFSDGAVLTLGQDTEVDISGTQITLVNGVAQYTSGSVSRTVTVPGATIELLGTDIDVLTDGSTSTVRVRDGVIRMTGSVSGAETIGIGDIAASVSGVVGNVTPGSPTYVTHTDTVSTQIDRTAPPLDVNKAAPYPDDAPVLSQDATIVGDPLRITLGFSKAVNVSGSPRLDLTINGTPRQAIYVSGSGTENLVFEYVLQVADAGASSIVITGFNENGATLMGSDGKRAVTTIADQTLNLSAPVTASDVTPPAGYAVNITTDPVRNTNVSAAAFTITGAELMADYNYTFTSSGGGSVTGSGTISSATQSVTGINLSSLPDGTLTLSVTLTDGTGNTGLAATDTAIKDATGPTGYTATFTTDPVLAGNQTAVAFSIGSAEVGTTYAYSISSSGGGTPRTGTGTVATATQNVTGINVSTLGDGTLTLSVTLTDTSGNAGLAATDTVVKDAAAPSGYTVAFTTDPVTTGNQNAAAFTISTAEVGTTYAYTISSSGGGTNVTGTGSVATATQAVTALNLSGLNDGTLSVSVTLTDAAGNVGAAATDTVLKDVAAPSGYTVAFTTDPVTSANATAAAFSIASAEVGTTYAYTVSSSGGGTNVTGTGTVTSATQGITAVNLSGLNDGTLTVSVTLTDAQSNTGTAATDTVTKDTTAASGYAVSFTTDPVNAGNVTAGAFTISSAEVGATFAYTISSSGGGTNVTGTGTIATATQNVTGLNLSGLANGTLTVSLTLTDTLGNTGTAVTDTVVKDATAPTGYSVAFTTDPIRANNVTAAAFSISGAEVGSTYSYTISSSGGAGTVTDTGTVATATQAVTGIDLTGVPDGTLTVSVTLADTAGNTGTAVTDTVAKDATTPTGYAVAFTTDPVNAANVTAGAFTITGAEVGAGFAYTISSSGGGTNVTGTGTIATATQNVTGLNLAGLTNGTLTVSLTLTDTAGNAGTAVTDTVVKDATAPTGYTALFTTDPVNGTNVTAGAFTISSAEVGSTYAYSISSSGGGTALTGSATVASATQTVTGINLSSLGDGTLTVSVTLTDAAGNTGTAATDTVVKDAVTPSAYTVAFTTDPVNATNVTATAFTLTGAEVGSTYAYSITSSGGGTAVTGTATVATATQAITGVDVSGLTDGTLTVSIILTDTAGNIGAAATDTVVKDVIAPTIVSVTPPADGTYGP